MYAKIFFCGHIVSIISHHMMYLYPHHQCTYFIQSYIYKRFRLAFCCGCGCELETVEHQQKTKTKQKTATNDPSTKYVLCANI